MSDFPIWPYALVPPGAPTCPHGRPGEPLFFSTADSGFRCADCQATDPPPSHTGCDACFEGETTAGLTRMTFHCDEITFTFALCPPCRGTLIDSGFVRILGDPDQPSTGGTG